MMTRRFQRPFATLIIGVALIALSGSVSAQKGGKPTSQPATGLFRCPGVDCPTADPTAVPAVLTDGIRGDQVSLSFSASDGA